MSQAQHLHVISHTHWDREWYQTMEAYRNRLVFLMDELIDCLETDPDYRFFHLDGQTIPLEDYLHIRPENDGRLRALISAGRILIGPWYVMPDQFLVSGESLVRNLAKGFAICRSYGVEPMKCGYAVDLFGHPAQMPQLFRGFGLDSAILFRGIADYPKDSFAWQAMDGSQVFCMRLDRDRTYCNFYFAIRWPFDGREYQAEELVDRMRRLLADCAEEAVSDHILMMDGVDHITIERALPRLLATIRRGLPETSIEHTTLPAYVRHQQAANPSLETIRGELYQVGRVGVNNWVLKNVLSAMVHLKQLNEKCETDLTRWVEPFNLVCGRHQPDKRQAFINRAWEMLLQNHPHDSICGCSISRVHQDNEYRFHQVMDINEHLIHGQLHELAALIDTSLVNSDTVLVVFNPLPWELNQVMETTIILPPDTQDNLRLCDAEGQAVDFQVIAKSLATVPQIDFRRIPEFPRKAVFTIAFPARIPAFGYSCYGANDLRSSAIHPGDYRPETVHQPFRLSGSMKTGIRTWENRFMALSLNSSGTLSVRMLDGGKQYDDLLVFESSGDYGDGWNYRKPLMDSVCTSLASATQVSVEQDGPLMVRWRLVHELALPQALVPGKQQRASEHIRQTITTLLTMRKDSPVLEFRTELTNLARHHRLRVCFPTRLNTDVFHTQTPFWLQERTIHLPDTSDHVEVETGVFPNQGLTILRDARDAIGLYNKGLYEVAVSDDADHSLMLTLFRSFPSEVGRDQAELGLMERQMTFEYALDFQPGTSSNGQFLRRAEQWRAGLQGINTTSHSGNLPSRSSWLEIKIPEVMVTACYRGKAGQNLLRLFNPTLAEQSGCIEFGLPVTRAAMVDLDQVELAVLPLNGSSLPIRMEPAKIVTIAWE